MMKITLFTLAALAAVCALPQDDPNAPPQPSDDKTVKIIKQNSETHEDGYSFEYELSDGTYRQEQGDYRNDTEQEGLLVKGTYRYVAPNGEHIQVEYVADKKGFQNTEHIGDDQPPAHISNDQPPAPVQS